MSRLPQPWVDFLFGKLTVRYGRAFLGQWPELDLSLVKSDWSEVLGGLDEQSLQYGLDNLDPFVPPTAARFRAVCVRAPRTDLALPEPSYPVPAVVSDAIRQARAAAADNRTPAQSVVDNILRIVGERDGRISAAQRHMLTSCRKVLNHDDPRHARIEAVA